MDTHESKTVLVGPNGEALIQKTPGVCGGDACVGNTRIMVWLLVAQKRGGLSDEEILAGYPTLTPADLAAAWEYYRRHPQEIDEAIASQEAED
jgi:uncharacterized protein (DUF433 family)